MVGISILSINFFVYLSTMSSLEAYGLQGLKKGTQSVQNEMKQTHFNSKLKYIINGIVYEAMVHLKNSIFTIISHLYQNSIKIDFWTVFQPFSTDSNEMGFFLRINSQQKYTFYVQNMDNLNLWKQKFSCFCIIKGFYNDYKPLSKLGTGKSAAVFLARRRIDGEKVAIKAFSKKQIENDCFFLEALQNQVKILRNLENPNIIKMKTLYQTQKSFYLISQYIEGKTLRHFLQTSSVKYSQSISILKKILQGLDYLESKDIVHRDLKPENIMIQDRSNRVVIVDFGLATYCKKRQYLYACCGTPGFVAPQILNQTYDELSPKVDIFSLGIIFHLMLIRKFPYVSSSYDLIVQENKLATFNFNNSQYQKIPFQTKNLLRKMLQKDPTQRISAAEMLSYFSQKKICKNKNEALSTIKTPKCLFSKCRRETSSTIQKSSSLQATCKSRIGRVY